MTVSSGFFNSVNHDRLYDAEQISSMFDGIITDGIYQGYGDVFEVKPVDGVNDTVTVGTGRAWFNHTWTLNDSPLSFELDPPNTLLSRVDAIVIDVNKEDSTRKNQIIKLTGEFAESSPKYPTLIKTELHKQYPLAYITIPAGQSAPISASNISTVIGTNDCPLVSGLFETMDLDIFVSQMNGKFNEWFDHIQSTIDEDVVLNLQNQIDDLADDIENQKFVTLNKAKDYSQVPYTGSYDWYKISSCFYRTTGLPGIPWTSSTNGTPWKFNIQPIIDKDGNYLLLFADMKSVTQVDYKFVKITNDGVLTTTVVKENALPSSESTQLTLPSTYSGFCIGPDGEIYAYIHCYGTNGATVKVLWGAPLTIYKLSNGSLMEIYTDSALVLKPSGNAPGPSVVNYTAYHSPCNMFYNKENSMYVIRTLFNTYYRFTSDFSLINEKKAISGTFPFIMSPSSGSTAYVGTAASTSSNGDAGPVRVIDISPDTWTTATGNVKEKFRATLPAISGSDNIVVNTNWGVSADTVEYGSDVISDPTGGSFYEFYTFDDGYDNPGKKISAFRDYDAAIPYYCYNAITRTLSEGSSSTTQNYLPASFNLNRYTYTLGMLPQIYSFAKTGLYVIPVFTGYQVAGDAPYAEASYYDFPLGEAHYGGFVIYNKDTGQKGIVVCDFSTEWVDKYLHSSSVNNAMQTYYDGKYPGNIDSGYIQFYNGYTCSYTNNAAYSAILSFAQKAYYSKDIYVGRFYVKFNEEL